MEKIFKWFTLTEEPNTLRYVWWFSKAFEPTNFKELDKLFMCYIQFCAKLSIIPKRESLTSYLVTDGKRDIKSNNIKLETMTAYDYNEASQLEEAFRLISTETLNRFDSFMEVDLTTREFKTDMYCYMCDMKAEAIQEAMMQFYPKLSDGSDVTEASRSLRDRLAKIDSIYDVNKLQNVEFTNNAEDDTQMRFLCKTNLPCVDGDLGGIFTKLIVTLNAQPSGGKTRMGLIHFIYQLITIAKVDCVFYELELSISQVKNILIAYHICVLYGGKIKIPDSLMNKKGAMSPEQQRIYESAKIDLFESGKFGKLVIRNKCVVEELEDELLMDIRSNPNLAYIGIDYMGLIASIPPKGQRRRERYEIITEAYEIVRRVLLAADVGALCINQYNDEGVKAAFAGKSIHSGHVQGGHIVERHTDYDLSITYTDEQYVAGMRDLQNSKTRGTKGFGRVQFGVDLSVSLFKQEQKV